MVMARQSMPKALSSLPSAQRSYISELSSEFEFGELKSWGVVGRLSGVVFGEDVRN
jgi:hypothetical protein